MRLQWPSGDAGVRHQTPHIDLAGDCGGDQGGAAFLKHVDSLSGRVLEVVNLLNKLVHSFQCFSRLFNRRQGHCEVGAFYWTVPAPDIVNLGREEQGSVSL